MPETDIGAILAAASRAPSVHNTQPWRFEVGSDVIDVIADRDRQLTFLDPTGRQLHVSCGAAAEFAFLAARAAGRSCAVDLLPDRTRSDVLARLRLGDAQPPTDLETRLAAAIAVRFTDRGPYSDEPVPRAVVDDVRRRATELGAWVRMLDAPDERRTAAAVLSASEAAEVADPRYAEELARWTGRAAAEEGMPAEATAPQWPAERVSDVPLRDFSGAGRHPRPGDHPEQMPPAVERDLLLMIGTQADDAASWLAAGRALGWSVLRAAADGVSAQPLGPAIDLPAGRDRLRHDLGLVGHAQFVLRLGYGTGAATTRRRAT